MGTLRASVGERPQRTRCAVLKLHNYAVPLMPVCRNTATGVAGKRRVELDDQPSDAGIFVSVVTHRFRCQIP